MPKLTAPLLSFKAQGTLGKVLTFCGFKGLSIAKKRPVPTDPKTLPQLYQRWRFYDAKQYWHSLSQAQRDQYEYDARLMSMTGWAYFLSLYLPNPLDQVLWLRFDRGYGAEALDSSGKDHPGTIVGAVWTDGDLGNALHFDGIDDYVYSEDHPDNRMLTPTAIARVRTTSAATANLVAKRYLGAYEGWALQITGGKANFVTGRTDPGNLDHHLASTTFVNDGEWHRISASYDGAVKHIFVDGELENSYEGADLIKGTERLITISRDATTAALFALADIDDPRLYNRGLTIEHQKYITGQELFPAP